MTTEETLRLIDSGLYAPGMSESDRVELMKARGYKSPLDTDNRGVYLSSMADNWSYWGQGQPDRKPATTVSFPVLRDRYRNSPIDKVIVMRRQMQVRRVAQRCIVPGKQVGFRVVHERWADPQYVPSESTEERCRLMERLICNVARDVCRDVKQFAAMEIKEELCIDRKAMIKFLDDRSGRPVAYAPIDAATILPHIAVLLPWMMKKGMALEDLDQAAEQMSEELKVQGVRDRNGKVIDLSKAAWVQVVNDEIKGAWTKDEMSIDIVNRDIEIDQLLYGKSCLEQSLELSELFVNALAYNMNIFSPNFPEGIIVVTGAYDKQGLEGFKRTLFMQSNQSGAQRIPVIPGDDQTFKVEWQKLRDTPKDMLFAELLRLVIDFKCAAYGMHPSEINFSPDGGGQSAMINEDDEGQAQEAATADGFNSMLDNLASWWTEALVRPYFPDLIVIWDGLSTDNEPQRVELNVKKLESYATLSEVRGSDNAHELVIPDDPADWDMTKLPLSSNFAQLAQIKWEALQMKQQMAAQSGLMPPDPNANYGEENPDWHRAGEEEPQDHGAEPPNWFMSGQLDSSGEPVKMKKPAGMEPTKKSMRQERATTMKYLRVMMDDDEGELELEDG